MGENERSNTRCNVSKIRDVVNVGTVEVKQQGVTLTLEVNLCIYTPFLLWYKSFFLLFFFSIIHKYSRAHWETTHSFHCVEKHLNRFPSPLCVFHVACSAGVSLGLANATSSRSFVRPAMFDLESEWTMEGRGARPHPSRHLTSAHRLLPWYKFLPLLSSRKIKFGSSNFTKEILTTRSPGEWQNTPVLQTVFLAIPSLVDILSFIEQETTAK